MLLYIVLYLQVLQYLFIFSTFLYLLYSQFSLYFLVLSSFCIFRVYFSSIFWVLLFLLNSQFLPISLYIFRFSISFISSGFTIFSIFSSFLHFLYFCAFHVLYFEFPLPLSICFLFRKCFVYLFVLRSQQMFLIPVMLEVLWFLWWGIHQNGWTFYNLISLKLQYILHIQMIIKSQYKV